MEVLVHPEPSKYLRRLNEPDKGRIKKAVKGLGEEPPEGDIKPLAGQGGIFRLAVGGYRILFRRRETGILVTHVEPRGQAYGKKNRGRKR